MRPPFAAHCHQPPFALCHPQRAIPDDDTPAACAGILSSIDDDQSRIPPATAQLLHPFGKHILTFLSLVHDDSDYADDTVRKEAINLLGDVCRVPGIRPEFMDPGVQTWIGDFLTQSTDVPPGTTEYAKQQIQQITST